MAVFGQRSSEFLLAKISDNYVGRETVASHEVQVLKICSLKFAKLLKGEKSYLTFCRFAHSCFASVYLLKNRPI